MKTISVIIPTYQHGATIEDCLDAILSQSRTPEEIIVVDDGSNDETQAKVSKYAPRVKYIYEENSGAPKARMNGFNVSKGDFVLFCDADVVLDQNALKKFEDVLFDNPDASFAYSSFVWGSKVFKSCVFNAIELKKRNYIHTTALIRREHFPGFDTSLKRFQDWDLWLTMIDEGRSGIFVDEILFKTIQVKGRENISNWLPSFVLRLPWWLIGWSPKKVADYFESKKIVMQKHNITA